MSLMRRLMAAKLTKLITKPAVPMPAPVVAAAAAPASSAPVVARGSCKAINADTGRQCALPGGHTGAHRHGSTAFIRVAAPGQSSFARRDALDAAGSSTNGGSNYE